MGLWSFTCVLPAETSDHEWTEEETEEQPGTSYDSKVFSYAHTRKSKVSGGGDTYEGARGTRDHHHRVHWSSGGAHMLACFRAGAINLIVHPALQVTVAGSQRQGASTVQPVNSLPRAAFLDGAADQDSGDEPTSPVVTCIGQVKKEKPRTPPKTPPLKAQVGDLRSLKLSKRERTTVPSKWRQILGARGTVNPATSSVQGGPRNNNNVDEFHVDLNRFSSTCSGTNTSSPPPPPLTPPLPSQTHTGTFLAKSLMMLQLECDEAKPCDSTKAKTLRPPLAMASRVSASDEVLLWKRRSGAKPLTLDLKRHNTVTKQAESTPSG